METLAQYPPDAIETCARHCLPRGWTPFYFTLFFPLWLAARRAPLSRAHAQKSPSRAKIAPSASRLALALAALLTRRRVSHSRRTAGDRAWGWRERRRDPSKHMRFGAICVSACHRPLPPPAGEPCPAGPGQHPPRPCQALSWSRDRQGRASERCAAGGGRCWRLGKSPPPEPGRVCGREPDFSSKTASPRAVGESDGRALRRRQHDVVISRRTLDPARDQTGTYISRALAAQACLWGTAERAARPGGHRRPLLPLGREMVSSATGPRACVGCGTPWPGAVACAASAASAASAAAGRRRTD